MPLLQIAEAALSSVPPGSVAIQLREKHLEARELVELARALLPICRARRAQLLVNDRIDIALALDLDGVHLPQASFKADDARRLLGSEKLIGVSCHSSEEVRNAVQCSADYATFGPIFDTPSKREFGPPVGLEVLRGASEATELPLYGLRGITEDNAQTVVGNGAVGIAVMGAWLAGQNAREAVQRLLAALPG